MTFLMKSSRFGIDHTVDFRPPSFSPNKSHNDESSCRMLSWYASSFSKHEQEAWNPSCIEASMHLKQDNPIRNYHNQFTHPPSTPNVTQNRTQIRTREWRGKRKKRSNNSCIWHYSEMGAISEAFRNPPSATGASCSHKWWHSQCCGKSLILKEHQSKRELPSETKHSKNQKWQFTEKKFTYRPALHLRIIKTLTRTIQERRQWVQTHLFTRANQDEQKKKQQRRQQNQSQLAINAPELLP